MFVSAVCMSEVLLLVAVGCFESMCVLSTQCAGPQWCCCCCTSVCICMNMDVTVSPRSHVSTGTIDAGNSTLETHMS
jgi:hypothetical protein